MIETPVRLNVASATQRFGLELATQEHPSPIGPLFEEERRGELLGVVGPFAVT
jgi:hypothetical protein